MFDEDLCRRTVFAHNWARSHHVGLERVIWQPELAATAEATAMAQGTDDAQAMIYNNHASVMHSCSNEASMTLISRPKQLITRWVVLFH